MMSHSTRWLLTLGLLAGSGCSSRSDSVTTDAGGQDLAQPADLAAKAPTDLAATFPSGAQISWQAPFGFTQVGPALTINSTGTMKLWNAVPQFVATGAPTTPPDRTIMLTAPQLDDLITRWNGTTKEGLPHAHVAAECNAVVYFLPCVTCTEARINYNVAAQLTPEMEDVWKWFDATLSSGDATNPRNYCPF